MRRIKTWPALTHDDSGVGISHRDYKLMRAVVRAAETLKSHQFHSERDLRLAADIVCHALDAFNAKGKGRG
jgi:hypothetical protein